MGDWRPAVCVAGLGDLIVLLINARVSAIGVPAAFCAIYRIQDSLWLAKNYTDFGMGLAFVGWSGVTSVSATDVPED
jgi:hypothetical protein